MIALIIGVLIGLVLGLTGAGGSVFAVPLLILLLGLPVNEAMGIALGAVSISALYGTINNWRYDSILWVPAIIFGVSGAITAPVGKLIGNQLSPTVLLLGFNVLALIIGTRMWLQTVRTPELSAVNRSGDMNPENFVQPVCRVSLTEQFEWRPRCVSSLAIGGLIVGLLAGLFGVGGGFLIVPLLLFLSQVSMQQAVGTSLFIISLVSAAGFISYATTTADINWPMLSLIAGGGLMGMYSGHFVGRKIAGPILQKIFAISVMVIALITLAHHKFAVG